MTTPLVAYTNYIGNWTYGLFGTPASDSHERLQTARDDLGGGNPTTKGALKLANPCVE